MSTQINPIDVITIKGDQPVTTSLKIAEVFGKRHDDVLKKIRNLKCSREFNERHFAPVEYRDAKGEKRRAYEMTKNGFFGLVMGFTGPKAWEFKEAYIEAFDWMADKLARRLPADPSVNEQQAAYLRSLVSQIAMRYPEAERPRMFALLYRRLHVAFEVKRYSDITTGSYPEAVEFLEDLADEYAPDQPVALPSVEAHDNNLVQIDLPDPPVVPVEIRAESLLNPDGNSIGHLLRQLRQAAERGQAVSINTVAVPSLEWSAALNLLRQQDRQLSTLRSVVQVEAVANVASL